MSDPYYQYRVYARKVGVNVLLHEGYDTAVAHAAAKAATRNPTTIEVVMLVRALFEPGDFKFLESLPGAYDDEVAA